jgi:hypothetical protein
MTTSMPIHARGLRTASVYSFRSRSVALVHVAAGLEITVGNWTSGACSDPSVQRSPTEAAPSDAICQQSAAIG